MARIVRKKTSPKNASTGKMTKTKKTPKKVSRTKSSASIDLTQFLIPGVIAFLVVWLLSNSMTFAGIIFLAVLIGNWFGQTYKNRK